MIPFDKLARLYTLLGPIEISASTGGLVACHLLMRPKLRRHAGHLSFVMSAHSALDASRRRVTSPRVAQSRATCCGVYSLCAIVAYVAPLPSPNSVNKPLGTLSKSRSPASSFTRSLAANSVTPNSGRPSASLRLGDFSN